MLLSYFGSHRLHRCLRSFVSSLIVKTLHGTSHTQAGDFPVMLHHYLGSPAASRDLLPAKHNPSPFWGHKTRLLLGLCKDEGKVTPKASSLYDAVTSYCFFGHLPGR